MELFSHFPDFLNTSKRALPRSPEAPVMRTEQPFGSEICDAAIATIHTNCIISFVFSNAVEQLRCDYDLYLTI